LSCAAQARAHSFRAFRFIVSNDKVCVSAFDDPKVPGVACHFSQARTGGIGRSLGLSEDPSRFAIRL
jgi:CreA protein